MPPVKPKPPTAEERASIAKKYATSEAFRAHMAQKYGKGTVSSMTSNERADIVHWSSTGIYELDDAMGWGIPGGRFVEFFGEESSGKTTELMGSMIENEYRGGKNVLADPEGTFNVDRYRQMGGNPDLIDLLEFETHEQFFDVLEEYFLYAANIPTPADALVLVGVDSMPMLVPKAHMTATSDQELVAVQARINSRNIPRINKKIPKNVGLVLLNQVRDKVGAMAWTAEGNIETPGGHILKHLASVRVLFNKTGQIDNGKEKEKRRIIGMRTGAKVVKNKVGPPFRKAEFRIMFDERGVDSVDHVLQAFISKGLIRKIPNTSNIEIKDKGTIPIYDFPVWLHKHPKWCAWALEFSFELYHKDVNLKRYLPPELRKAMK